MAAPEPVQSTAVLDFNMSGPAGDINHYRFDSDPSLLTGDEIVLLEQIDGGTFPQWLHRLTTGTGSGRDVLLLAYLAKRRENAELLWAPFIKTVSPYTMTDVEVTNGTAAVAPPAPNRATRRTAAKTTKQPAKSGS